MNENDPKVVAWLRKLFPDDHIDEADVQDVEGDFIQHYERVHLFAGIGGWELALHLAGWPADRPVWTGSCPCQPFSVAGKRHGTKDSRHLWPEMLRLIAVCRPATIFGEQVASKLGREWLAGVFDDLEALGYRCARADLCAASVGAPHIRQRLYWVAQSNSEQDDSATTRRFHSESGECSRGLADSAGFGSGLGGNSGAEESEGGEHRNNDVRRTSRIPDSQTAERELTRRTRPGREGFTDCGNGLSDSERLGRAGESRRGARRVSPLDSARHDAWEPSEFIRFADGKTRRIEPGLVPLAHGVPARMVRIRGYGNAIVPQVAAQFVKSFLEVSDAAQVN